MSTVKGGKKVREPQVWVGVATSIIRGKSPEGMGKVIKELENHYVSQVYSYKRQKFPTLREYLQIYNILSDVIAWAYCTSCQVKFLHRRRIISKFWTLQITNDKTENTDDCETRNKISKRHPRSYSPNSLMLTTLERELIWSRALFEENP